MSANKDDSDFLAGPGFDNANIVKKNYEDDEDEDDDDSIPALHQNKNEEHI